MKRAIVMITVLAAAMAMAACSKSDSNDGNTAVENGVDESVVEEETVEEDQDTQGFIPLSYSCEMGSISLEIPKDWEYQIHEYSEGNKQFSIEIHPESETEGTLTFACMEHFGVCGTGLEEREYSQNGMSARVGIYDNHSYWDFMVFTDSQEGYVILNSAGSSWWDMYEDQVEQILSTVSFGNIQESEVGLDYEDKKIEN